MQNPNKNKSQINLIIDGILFILIMAITGLGFLIKSVLLPGRVAHGVYGERTELFFLGLNRHEWGHIHLVLGLIFVLLLAIHIILHWKFIRCVYQQMLKKTVTRWIVGFIAGIVPLFFLLAPTLITPEVKPLTPHNLNRSTSIYNNSNSTNIIPKEETDQPAKPKSRRVKRGRRNGAGQH